MVVGPEIEAKVPGSVMEKLLQPVTKKTAQAHETAKSADFNANECSGLARTIAPLQGTSKGSVWTQKNNRVRWSIWLVTLEIGYMGYLKRSMAFWIKILYCGFGKVTGQRRPYYPRQNLGTMGRRERRGRELESNRAIFPQILKHL
jgi:hypothetical protein